MLSSKDQPKIQLTPVSKLTSSSTTNNTTDPISSKTLQKHKRLITRSISDWVCSNTRPINIVEDIGLKNLMDQCVKIGIIF
jgi:hypothetical protein